LALCVVLEFCSSSCAWPEPPQPHWQLEELFWDWTAPWFVTLELEAWEPA
jgi:hypothetical protein